MVKLICFAFKNFNGFCQGSFKNDKKTKNKIGKFASVKQLISIIEEFIVKALSAFNCYRQPNCQKRTVTAG